MKLLPGIRALALLGNKAERGGTIWGEWCQDHMPVRQQSEIVGHAVRAMYLYAGVADVAAYIGDQPMIDAMGRLWQDVVRRKMYITGGIGARVEVFAGSKRQTAERVAGSGYLSQNDERLHFGLGAATSVDKVIVRWPSGKEQTLEKQSVDRTLTVEEPK